MTKASEIAPWCPRPRALLDTPAADYGVAPDNTVEFDLHAIFDGRKPNWRAGKPWEASYERGWSVSPVRVSCSLSTLMRISIAALDLGRWH